MLKLSVVIPLYNKEAYVRKTIISLAEQVLKPFELIVVDDASSDAGLEVVKETIAECAAEFTSTKVIIIELEENGGPGNARNTGLEQATGDVISFLDADDGYHSEFVHKVTHYMQRYRMDFLVVGFELRPSNLLCPNVSKLNHYLKPVNDELFEIPHPLLAVSSPHFFMGRGSNVVVTRQMVAEHRYELGAVLNEGVDFWYRVLKSVKQIPGSKIGLLSGDYIRVTEVQGSLSRRTYRHWEELKRPPSVHRYRMSRNRFDQQLSGMLTLRWYHHAMKSIISPWQRMLFVLHHRTILIRALRLRFVRPFMNHRETT